MCQNFYTLGSFFYFSYDSKYLLKTIPQNEFDFPENYFGNFEVDESDVSEDEMPKENKHYVPTVSELQEAKKNLKKQVSAI